MFDLVMPVVRRQLHANAAEPANVVWRGFNVHQAATYAATSVWQVRKWIHLGDLKAARIGKRDVIDKAALDSFLDSLFQAASN